MGGRRKSWRLWAQELIKEVGRRGLRESERRVVINNVGAVTKVLYL
jgi:hypothetical protein